MHHSDFFYNVVQHMSKSQYRVQYRRETNHLTEEEEQTLSIQSPDYSSWGKPDEFCTESGELERAAAVG